MTPPATSVRDRLPTLRVTEPGQPTAPTEEPATMPPWLAAVGGGLAASAVGWVLPAALVLVGWLVDMAGSTTLPLRVATEFWFAGHGGGATLGSTTWTMVPLGLTVLQLLVLTQVAAFAARQAPAPERGARGVLVRCVALLVLGYLVPLVTVAVLVGSPEQLVRVLVGGTLLALAGGSWGAVRAVGLPWPLPAWLRRLPRALGAGAAVMWLLSAAVLVFSVVQHLGQVRALSEGAAPEPLSAVVLVLAQLAFLPNLVLWAMSYLLGAGFTVATDSVVSPMVTELGLLPGVPVLGALPAEGVGGWTSLLWLLAGVAAGAVTAVVLLRGLRPLRFDAACLVGGLVGALAGLVLTAAGAASRGSLGSGRLTGLGPRLDELAVMSVTVLGIAGLVAGFVHGLVVRRPRDEDGPAGEDVEVEEDTRVLRRLDADETTQVLRRKDDPEATQLLRRKR